ncbi:MAG: potassium transporter KtrB [Ruminococcaceae bacterium]|nr:potassium transporter KtrB [Oscillospiraceae bacterium]
MKRYRRRVISTTHWILLSFLSAILVGSLLLSLPISAADGNAVPFVDAFFTATSATCVTGLTTLPIVSTWSFFGQAVILLLIQIGGLGIITVFAGVMVALRKTMGLHDRLLIQDAFNLNTMSGLSAFVKKVILGSLAIEAIGALLCMIVFVPDYGARGIWISVFHSVSAFCNAGMDVLSENSLIAYAVNPLINTVTMLLIVLGGVGFIVWWDVLRVCKEFPKKKFRCLRHLTLHSKVALSMTVLLLVGGAICFFCLERRNPLTMADASLGERIWLSLFQSVTTRTAGFATLPQQDLTDASALISLLLMFIGGSPVGTAGGIKTVTVTVLVAAAISAMKNRNEVTLYRRTLSAYAVRKAIAVTGMSFAILFVSAVLLTAVTDASALDVLYETVSATATVGLSRNLTPFLNTAGKLIIILTMYLGRVGPISLAVALNLKKTNENIIKAPIEELSVG